MSKRLTAAIGITRRVGGLMLHWVPGNAIGSDDVLVLDDTRVWDKFWDSENIPYQV